MLLEWRAQERRLAIADALEFRGHRRSLIPGTAERESRLEINEGLAQYTGVRLANAGGADRQAAAIFALHDGPGRMSLVRSFAMRQGLRMACCLMSPAWRKRLTAASDLGETLGSAYRVTAGASAQVAAARYGGDLSMGRGRFCLRRKT
jgi:hypothetical protein